MPAGIYWLLRDERGKKTLRLHQQKDFVVIDGWKLNAIAEQ
jgi:hypothetical protein